MLLPDFSSSTPAGDQFLGGCSFFCQHLCICLIILDALHDVDRTPFSLPYGDDYDYRPNLSVFSILELWLPPKGPFSHQGSLITRSFSYYMWVLFSTMNCYSMAFYYYNLFYGLRSVFWIILESSVIVWCCF